MPTHAEEIALTAINTTPSLEHAIDINSVINGAIDSTDRAEGTTTTMSIVQDATLDEAAQARTGIRRNQYLYKTHEFPDRAPHASRLNLMQIEVAGANLMKLLLPKQCAHAFSVIEPDGIARSCVIERVDGLETLDQIHMQRDLGMTAQELLDNNIVPVLVFQYLLENNDFRNGNLGLTPNGFFAFDFDRLLWGYPTCALIEEGSIRNLAPHEGFDKDKFPLSVSGIQNFPILQDSACPDQWPADNIKNYNNEDPFDRRSQAFAEQLQTLKDNPQFIEQKYYCFFKYAIIFSCPILLNKALEKSINPTCQEFSLLKQHHLSRAQQLRYLLLADEHFKPFLPKVNEWYQEICSRVYHLHSNQAEELQQQLSNGYGDFYKEYAQLQTQQTSPRRLSKRASEYNIDIRKEPARQGSLINHNNPNNKQLLVNVAFNLALLLNKHRNTNKVEKKLNNKQYHPRHNAYIFCKSLSDACAKNDREKIAYILRRTPQIKGTWLPSFQNKIKKYLKSDEFKSFDQAFAYKEQQLNR